MSARGKLGKKRDETLIIICRYCFDAVSSPPRPPIQVFYELVFLLTTFQFTSPRVDLFFLIPQHLLNNTSVVISLLRRNGMVRYMMDDYTNIPYLFFHYIPQHFSHHLQKVFKVCRFGICSLGEGRLTIFLSL